MNRASEQDWAKIETKPTGYADRATLDLRDSLAALTRRVEAMEANYSKTSNSSPAKCPECGGLGHVESRGPGGFRDCPTCTAKPTPTAEKCWACGEQLIGKPLACPRCSNPFTWVAVPTPPAEQPEVESVMSFVKHMNGLCQACEWAEAEKYTEERDTAIETAERKAAVGEFAEKLISGTIGVEINSRTAWFAYIRTAAQEYAK